MLKYFQIPYCHNGRDFTGTDCWGFVILYFKEELGIALQDYKKDIPGYYSDIKNTDLFSSHTDEEYRKVTELKKYDLLLLCNGSKTPNHIAIYLGNRKIIHMMATTRVVISKLSVWKDKIYGMYRYNGEINAD